MSNSKGSVQGIVIGLFFFMFFLFLSISAQEIFPNVAEHNISVLRIALLFIGLVSIIIGALER